MNNRIRLRSWHKYLGLFCCLFLMLLSVTGWSLNHTGYLGLDNRYASQAWLLRWYGIDQTRPEGVYEIATNSWVAKFGSNIYLNNQLLTQTESKLVGAIKIPGLDILAVGLPGEVFLFTLDGELVEKINGLAVFKQRVGDLGLVNNTNLAIKTIDTIWFSDRDVLNWSTGDITGVVWSKRGDLPEALRQSLAQRAIENVLSWEQVILDLHSGRILGGYGVWVFDFVALAIFTLSVTGFWIWFGGKSKRKG